MDDLYTADSNFGAEGISVGYTEVLARMEKLDEALRDVQKKHKKRKHSKKEGSKKKKIKKRLKTLERDNEKIVEYLRIVTTQTQAPPQSPLWKGLLEKSAPKLIDLASTIIQTKRQPAVQYLPARSHLLLTDNSDRK